MPAVSVELRMPLLRGEKNMPLPSSRPPLTEGAAAAIAQETKNPHRSALPSEVPMAFQSRQAESAPTQATARGTTGLSAKSKRKLLVLGAVVATAIVVAFFI